MTKYAFNFGQALPADPLGIWLSGLSLGFNDLVLANKRLVEGVKQPGTKLAYEDVYSVRIAASHAWEVVKLLQAGQEDPQVAAFIEKLPVEAKNDLSKALDLVEGEADPKFKGALARARDLFSHYPELARKESMRPLEALAAEEATFTVGNNLAMTRLDYADEVAARLLFREPADLAAFKQFVTSLRDLTQVLLALVQRIVKARLDEFPPGSVITI